MRHSGPIDFRDRLLGHIAQSVFTDRLIGYSCASFWTDWFLGIDYFIIIGMINWLILGPSVSNDSIWPDLLNGYSRSETGWFVVIDKSKLFRSIVLARLIPSVSLDCLYLFICLDRQLVCFGLLLRSVCWPKQTDLLVHQSFGWIYLILWSYLFYNSLSVQIYFS